MGTSPLVTIELSIEVYYEYFVVVYVELFHAVSGDKL